MISLPFIPILALVAQTLIILLGAISSQREAATIEHQVNPIFISQGKERKRNGKETRTIFMLKSSDRTKINCKKKELLFCGVRKE